MAKLVDSEKIESGGVLSACYVLTLYFPAFVRSLGYSIATIAKGMGCYGEGPITDGDKVGPALKRAIEHIKKEGKPVVVDTVTQFR